MSVSQDKGPLFSTTVKFSKIQAVFPPKWRRRTRDIMRFWARLRKLRHIVQQWSPTWYPRAPSRPQGPSRSPAGLF